MRRNSTSRPSDRTGADGGRNWAERLARCQLEAVGMTFLAANHTERRGELDLVMQDGELVVFVEVRHRASAEYGSASESIDAPKLERMRRSARPYLLRHYRTDVVPCRLHVLRLPGTAL